MIEKNWLKGPTGANKGDLKVRRYLMMQHSFSPSPSSLDLNTR
jgi:hypothetical protein